MTTFTWPILNATFSFNAFLLIQKSANNASIITIKIYFDKAVHTAWNKKNLIILLCDGKFCYTVDDISGIWASS